MSTSLAFFSPYIHKLGAYTRRGSHLPFLFSLSSVRLSEPPTAGARLALAVEVKSGDGRSKVVDFGKVARVELLSPAWGVNRLPAALAKEKEDDPVDSQRRARVLVGDDLISCSNPSARHSKLPK